MESLIKHFDNTSPQECGPAADDDDNDDHDVDDDDDDDDDDDYDYDNPQECGRHLKLGRSLRLRGRGDEDHLSRAEPRTGPQQSPGQPSVNLQAQISYYFSNLEFLKYNLFMHTFLPTFISLIPSSHMLTLQFRCLTAWYSYMHDRYDLTQDVFTYLCL